MVRISEISNVRWNVSDFIIIFYFNVVFLQSMEQKGLAFITRNNNDERIQFFKYLNNKFLRSDKNYRKIVGKRKGWQFSHFKRIVNVFSSPFVCRFLINLIRKNFSGNFWRKQENDIKKENWSNFRLFYFYFCFWF